MQSLGQSFRSSTVAAFADAKPLADKGNFSDLLFQLVSHIWEDDMQCEHIRGKRYRIDRSGEYMS